ncbi:hypothetical protein Daesc_006782 [Daldinia eschscholtzii]|uniref:Carbohydrate kinase PfkB domain-containing protein n=1 Tax=Daldinia eschscholtzii TaxID=292717 RepID=A0AAX6MIK4_9PEZI
MKKLVCVGACYVDTILDVPQYPGEDSKLRATNLQVRRGGNCPNTLQVLQQLLREREREREQQQQQQEHDDGRGRDFKPYLISCLPSADAPATATIMGSFGPESLVDFSRCIFREDHQQPASSYIIRSEATGSRTLVNYNDLPEMTIAEFVVAVDEIGDNNEDNAWFHFECIRHLRRSFPNARVSVEVEKPGREGLEDLAAEADVVFYSRSWAESKRTVGAGDTFIAGMLFGLLCHDDDWDTEKKVQFAVQLATCKVQRDGFDGLGSLGFGNLAPGK